MGTRVAIVLCSWNHLETTTRPCIASLRWFTDRDYRLLWVDNASTDGTHAFQSECAGRDPRVVALHNATNLGWARGTRAALGHLAEEDAFICLLNSDTILTPRWLSRMLAVLEADPGLTCVVANESPELAGTVKRIWDRLVRRAPPRATAIERPHEMTPGTRPAARPPRLDAVLDVAARTAARFAGRSEPAPPSGFCLLVRRSALALLTEYLDDFEGYRSCELDWQGLWERHGASCRVALDAFVFHARGGSGGYYIYGDRKVL